MRNIYVDHFEVHSLCRGLWPTLEVFRKPTTSRFSHHWLPSPGCFITTQPWLWKELIARLISLQLCTLPLTAMPGSQSPTKKQVGEFLKQELWATIRNLIMGHPRNESCLSLPIFITCFQCNSNRVKAHRNIKKQPSGWPWLGPVVAEWAEPAQYFSSQAWWDD